MTSIVLSGLGTGLVVAATIWLLGGIFARWTGLLLVALGAGYLIGAQARGLAMLAVGVTLWLAGHWLFAVKHRAWKSIVAERIFHIGILARLAPLPH